MFVGIDLTSSEKKASACAVLDAASSLAYLDFRRTDSEITTLADEMEASCVGIDAPLGFPRGMCCLDEECACRSGWPFKGRVCERELIGRRISLYVTTKRSFIKPMIYRAIRLAEDLRGRGHDVVEVYPYASKICLFGRPIPPKTTAAGIRLIRDRLARLIDGLDSLDKRLDHDLCDAVVAAYTTYLHHHDRTVVLGVEDEAQIVLPRVNDGLERSNHD